MWNQRVIQPASCVRWIRTQTTGRGLGPPPDAAAIDVERSTEEGVHSEGAAAPAGMKIEISELSTKEFPAAKTLIRVRREMTARSGSE